jgi:hypothetical protein
MVLLLLYPVLRPPNEVQDVSKGCRLAPNPTGGLYIWSRIWHQHFFENTYGKLSYLVECIIEKWSLYLCYFRIVTIQIRINDYSIQARTWVSKFGDFIFRIMKISDTLYSTMMIYRALSSEHDIVLQFYLPQMEPFKLDWNLTLSCPLLSFQVSWARTSPFKMSSFITSLITECIAPIFIIVSPITSYADQTCSIYRSKSSAGFSLDIPLIMLVASLLRNVPQCRRYPAH